MKVRGQTVMVFSQYQDNVKYENIFNQVNGSGIQIHDFIPEYQIDKSTLEEGRLVFPGYVNVVIWCH